MPSVQLDENHGVNPGLIQCFFCGKEIGIALYGRLTTRQRAAFEHAGIPADESGKAPSGLVIDKEPCPECKGHMEQGVLFISCREPELGDDSDNPYRTGGWCVVKDEAVRRMGIQPEELLEDILSKRVAFVPDEAWDMLGLPRGETPGVSNDTTSTD